VQSLPSIFMRKHLVHTKTKSKELMRLEAFSDGVFAIAITLLVLELVQMLHNHEAGSLTEMLASNWRSFAAFLIGFLTILICWINHHLVVSYIERTDSLLFWVNGFVLLVVTFTPLPTAVLAGYIEKESHYALAFFGFNYVMMSLAAYCLSAYILNRLTKKTNASLLFYHTILYKYSIFYTVLVFIICFVSVPLAIFFYILLFIVFAFPKEFSIILERRKAR
jgi:uncharacterized membrane protein